MNLGEELKEENRKKKERREREAAKQRAKERIEAEKEAEERFPVLTEGLEDKIREKNEKGGRSIELISSRNTKLSEADWKVYWKLQDWAQKRGLRTYTIDFERDIDGYNTYPSAGITWEEPRKPRW